MVGEMFQIYGVQIIGKYICESKNQRIYLFLPISLSKTFSQILIIMSRQKEITHYPWQCFLEIYFPQAEKGGGRKLWKSWKNDHVWGYWT